MCDGFVYQLGKLIFIVIFVGNYNEGHGREGEREREGLILSLAICIHDTTARWNLLVLFWYCIVQTHHSF